MVKQLLIMRRDLHMTSGKLAAQASHCSMAFLSNLLRNGEKEKVCDKYQVTIELDIAIMEQWIEDRFTKVVCGAKNKNQLMKAVQMAEEMGMKENEHFFIIKDCCLTELEPEEFDENGVGRTITGIGFVPMEAEKIEKISRKFQLLK